MSEEIKERARAATARILGTLPGCTTCVEAADTIARLTRELDEAVDRATVFDFDREHARLRAIALDEICMAIFGPGEHTVDEVRAAVPALVARADAAEARVRELEDRIAALEAQLTTRGACQCGYDEVCALARRAQEAERELDRVRVDLVTAQHAIGEGWFAGGVDTATAIERKTRALEDGARYAYARAAAAEERAQEAEAKTENIRASLIGLINDHAFRDVPLSWRTTLLGMLDKVGGGVPTPTTPAPEKCDRCGEGDAEVELGSVLRWCKPCFAGAQDEAERTYYPTAPAAPVAAAMTVAMMAAATLTTPAPEQAGEGKRCPHACIDEHEQPTDESCPFSKPCPVHDAREVRRG